MVRQVEMKLTNEERLMQMETKLEAVREDLVDIKAGQHELLIEFRRHCETADQRYATRDEVSMLRKWLYVLSGALVTFLVWAFEQYLTLR